MTKRGWARRGALVAVALLTTACGGGDSPEAGQGQAQAAEVAESPEFSRVINVEVRELTSGAFDEQIRLTGTVWADRDVQVSAEESGVIREILAEKGRRVSAGQPLARIDSEILRAQVNQAEAQAELASQTWDRRRRLWEEDRVGSEIAYLEAKATAEQARANLEVLQRRLGRTVIRAPFAGVLDQRSVEVGTMVSPGQTVARIVSLDPVKVVAGVPERYASNVHRGDLAKVYFEVLREQEFAAEISYVGSTVDPQNRTFPIEIRMSNPQGMIKPEMEANVLVDRRRLEDVVVVPQDAVVRVEDGYVAFVAEEHEGREVARVRPVVLGPSQNNSVVIESGLDSGDRLIVVGQKSVADGDRINVVANGTQG